VQRDPRVVEARELVGGLGVERWEVGVKALADALGKSRDGVSLWVRRAARRRSEDEAFADRLEDLDQRLAASFKKWPAPDRTSASVSLPGPERYPRLVPSPLRFTAATVYMQRGR